MKAWMTLQEAVAETPYGEKTLRRAVKKVKVDEEFPPPLKSRRDRRGRIIISAEHLTAWMDRNLT